MGYLGEALAVGSAFIWSFSVILFKKTGETAHPLALNAFKNTLAVLLFAATSLALGQPLLPAEPSGDYLLLLLSGAIGIGLADTLYFVALNLMGASWVAIADCLFSPTMITLAMLFLGEQFVWPQAAGAAMIILAVYLATRQAAGAGRADARKRLYGVVCSMLAVLFVAVSIIIAKPVLSDAPLLWAVEVRLAGGVMILAVLLLAYPRRTQILSTLWAPGRVRYVLLSSFFGTYLTMLCWLAAHKYGQSSVVAVLSQSSTIFIFFTSYFFLGEPLTRRKWTAVALALPGAVLVILFRTVA